MLPSDVKDLPDQLQEEEKYGRLTNKNDTNTIKCLLCNQTNKGGINRLKNHLAGIRGNIRKCPKADPEVQREIREYLETLKKKQEDKKRAREDLTADVNIIDKGLWKQQVIKGTYGKDLRDKVNDFLAFWVYKRGISFNSLTDSAFLRFCEAVGQYGPGYKPPTVYEYRMPLLQRQVAKTTNSLQPYKEVWAKTDFVENGVKEVGEENVLHVVTDNAAANMKVAELFMAKHPRIYWTSCAAHNIDLMLESISKQKEISDAIRQAKEITNFIYNHHQVLSLMRVHMNNKDIVRPGATRFATSFLTLDSISQKKSQLRRFFLSDEYIDLIESSKKKRKNGIATKVFLPLVLLLRIVDGEEKQPMGFVYGGLKDAIKEIKAAFRYNEDVFEPYVKVIVDGMKGILKRLKQTLLLWVLFLIVLQNRWHGNQVAVQCGSSVAALTDIMKNVENQVARLTNDFANFSRGISNLPGQPEMNPKESCKCINHRKECKYE
ncbi:uncharacterized protein LOC144568097 [Carex rostrata]